MYIDTVKTLQQFKNTVCDLFLKNGDKRLGCDIGTGGDTTDKVIIIEDGIVSIYPISEVSSIHYYDKGD
jgi:hypothetical protein